MSAVPWSIRDGEGAVVGVYWAKPTTVAIDVAVPGFTAEPVPEEEWSLYDYWRDKTAAFVWSSSEAAGRAVERSATDVTS